MIGYVMAGELISLTGVRSHELQSLERKYKQSIAMVHQQNKDTATFIIQHLD